MDSTNVKYDYVSSIIAYENGETDDDETIALFQYLVDTGLAWSLQGSYGRAAVALIDAGEITGTVPGRNPEPKPEKVGTYCECGAPYVYLERYGSWGYSCAR